MECICKFLTLCHEVGHFGISQGSQSHALSILPKIIIITFQPITGIIYSPEHHHHHDSTNHSHNLFSHITLLANEMILSQHLKMVPRWLYSACLLLALWGIKKWVPSMKVKKLQKYVNKSGLMGCNWSSLNALGTESPLSHSVLKLEEFPLLHYWPSGVIRIDSPV